MKQLNCAIVYSFARQDNATAQCSFRVTYAHVCFLSMLKTLHSQHSKNTTFHRQWQIILIKRALLVILFVRLIKAEFIYKAFNNCRVTKMTTTYYNRLVVHFYIFVLLLFEIVITLNKSRPECHWNQWHSYYK